MSIAEEIKTYRKDHGLSMVKFAEEAGLNPNTIVKLENNKILNPKQDTLNKLFLLFKKGSCEKQPVTKIDRTIAKKLEPVALSTLQLKPQQIQTPTVRAIVKYEITAEVDLDVHEQIVSMSPITTQRIYENPTNQKVLVNGFGEGNIEIIKILAEHPPQRELTPSYIN